MAAIKTSSFESILQPTGTELAPAIRRDNKLSKLTLSMVLVFCRQKVDSSLASATRSDEFILPGEILPHVSSFRPDPSGDVWETNGEPSLSRCLPLSTLFRHVLILSLWQGL
jgi:hypothetical protein